MPFGQQVYSWGEGTFFRGLNKWPDLAVKGGVLLGSLETCLGASQGRRTVDLNPAHSETRSTACQEDVLLTGGGSKECSDDAGRVSGQVDEWAVLIDR